MPRSAGRDCAWGVFTGEYSTGFRLTTERHARRTEQKSRRTTESLGAESSRGSGRAGRAAPGGAPVVAGRSGADICETEGGRVKGEGPVVERGLAANGASRFTLRLGCDPAC